MTPLIMVISFSDSHAAHLRGARPADRRREQVRRPSATRVLVVGPACVLTHATAALSFIALAVLQLRPDPHLRRGGPDRDDHRACRGADRWCRCSACCSCATRAKFAAKVAGRRHRRERAAPLLRLDRGAHGQPSRALQPDQPHRRRRARHHLRQARAALSPRRPGAGQASRRSPPAAVSTPSSPAPIRSTC